MPASGPPDQTEDELPEFFDPHNFLELPAGPDSYRKVKGSRVIQFVRFLSRCNQLDRL